MSSFEARKAAITDKILALTEEFAAVTLAEAEAEAKATKSPPPPPAEAYAKPSKAPLKAGDRVRITIEGGRNNYHWRTAILQEPRGADFWWMILEPGPWNKPALRIYKKIGSFKVIGPDPPSNAN